MAVPTHAPHAFLQAVCERFPALAQLPHAALDRLVRESSHAVLPPATRVFDESGPCRSFPLVLRGAVKVFKQAPSGRQLLLYRVEPGELCVLTAGCLLGRTAYSATGSTEGEVELLALGVPLFDALLADHEPFRHFVFSVFSGRIVDLMRLVEEVAFQRLDHRLAALLLARGPELRATHQDLANELGSVREIVSRLLKHFEEQGLVTLARERVVVRDAEGLRQVSGG